MRTSWRATSGVIAACVAIAASVLLAAETAVFPSRESVSFLPEPASREPRLSLVQDQFGLESDSSDADHCSSGDVESREASTTSAQEWVASYNGPGDAGDGMTYDLATSIGVSPDGQTVYVTGRSTGPGTGTFDDDFATVAYSASTGAQRWIARYDGPNSDDGDVATALAVSPDGCDIYVTGHTYERTANEFDYDYITVAYSAHTGEQRWVSRHGGPAHGVDRSYFVAVSPDGSTVFVSGVSFDVPWSGEDDTAIGKEPRYLTVAYSAKSGDEVWDARYAGPGGEDTPNAMAVSPDGAMVLVTGYSEPADGFGDYGTVAYSATTGRRLWEARFEGRGGSADYPREIAFSPDGSLVVVTGARHHGDSSATTVAYSAATGDQRWVVDDPSFEAQAMAVDLRSSSVYVSGYGWNQASHYFATAAYDLEGGAELWSVRYKEPENPAEREPYEVVSMGVTPDGSRVFVAGYSGGPRDGYQRRTENLATVAYATLSGEQLWVGRYNGPHGGEDQASALAVSPTGERVFVTGHSSRPSSYTASNFTTIAYDASARGSTEGGPPDRRRPDHHQPTSCRTGDRPSGPISKPVHEFVEPSSGPGRSTVRTLKCELARRGL